MQDGSIRDKFFFSPIVIGVGGVQEQFLITNFIIFI